MVEYLPHQIKLAEMEFACGVMPKTENALHRLALDVSEFQAYTVQRDLNDLNDLAEDLHAGEWAQLTQAADASLVHVIFNNLSATQKEVLRSLLAEEYTTLTEVQVTRLGCAIELSPADWDKLEALDYLEEVAPALVRAGAINNTVEYEGHYGSVVYFDVFSGDDPKRVVDALRILLKE